MRELELKLSVDDPFVTPPLRGDELDIAGMEELPALDLRATYYDTHDLRLARHGITLRHRTGEGDGSGWTLKLPLRSGDGAARDEIRLEGRAGEVPAGARDLVTAHSRGTALGPVARLRTRRRRWCLRGREGGALAELVDDRVSVIKQGRVVERFRELEIEARDADRALLEQVAELLQAAGAAAPAPVPKVVRALGPKATLPPDVVVPRGLTPSGPAAFAVQAAIARSVNRIVDNDAGTRLGEVEPVHQMRVGTRRLRSDLRTFRSLVDAEWADRLREELRWLGEALGAVRDLDVMSERLHAESGDLTSAEPLFAHLDEQHLVARAALLRALRSRRYVELLDSLVEAARSPSLTDDAWLPSTEVLPPLAARAWRKLAKKARSLAPGDADADHHRVRILAKRARYASEAIVPALGRKRAIRGRRFAARAADVQDALGGLQDSVVARSLIEEVAGGRPTDGPFGLAAGRLLEREAASARESRAGFAKAWKRLDRPKLRRWM